MKSKSVLVRSEKKISIIVPCYNSRDYVNRLIDSINEQLYNNYEVIFIDDESSDDTYSFLKKECDNDGRFKVYRKKHAGPGPARRLGFKKSSGELLLFVDCDDWLYASNVLSEINYIFNENEIDICLSFRKSFPSDELLEPFDDVALEPGIYDMSIFNERQIRGAMGVKVFKREILNEKMFVGFYNYEDMFTTINYLDRCKRVMYTDQVFQVLNRGKNNNSLTASSGYAKRTLQERATGIVKLSKSINNQYLQNSLANLALGAYCNFYSYRLIDDESKAVRDDLKRLIRTADLTGFCHLYSFKKRLILWIIKHGGLKCNEN